MIALFPVFSPREAYGSLSASACSVSLLCACGGDPSACAFRRRPDAMSLEPGTTFGSYEVTAKIGEGGMGAVWRAFDTSLERVVAIKVLPSDRADEADWRRRFGREAKAAAALNHPNICTVYEVGEHDGQPFIAMEYIAGRALNELIGPSGLPVEQVVRYGLQIAGALAHAHSHHVIHRDLTASNVVVTDAGLAKVLDFGLAKRERAAAVDETTVSEPSSLTDARVIVGTPGYLAPELFAGEAATPLTDIWALGVLLYRMACGHSPFKRGTMFELSAAILREPHRPLPSSVPADLVTVVDRCLRKSRRQRYQRARDVEAALESARQQITAGGREPSRASEDDTTDVTAMPGQSPRSPVGTSVVADPESVVHLTRLLETFRTMARMVWTGLLLVGILGFLGFLTSIAFDLALHVPSRGSPVGYLTTGVRALFPLVYWMIIDVVIVVVGFQLLKALRVVLTMAQRRDRPWDHPTAPRQIQARAGRWFPRTRDAQHVQAKRFCTRRHRERLRAFHPGWFLVCEVELLVACPGHPSVSATFRGQAHALVVARDTNDGGKGRVWPVI